MNQTQKFRYEWEWSTVHWREMEVTVFKLQKRIYRASKEGNAALVKKLQRLLLRSHANKLLAVRRVTQDNRGKKTAGVDGKTSLTAEEREITARTIDLKGKAMPIRRVWIDKPGKKEKRPLGIPTIDERIRQAIVKAAMEPEWEAKFEPNSYGFRPGRCCHDALSAIHNALGLKQAFVLDADIAGCFDNINHDALLKKTNTSPQLRRRIKGWLKAGIMEDAFAKPNESGTPQGGILSPLLANIALHGMETETKQGLKEILLEHQLQDGKSKYAWEQTLSVIRYADDFVVIHRNKEVVEKAKEFLAEWLSKVGLELKPSKTRLCHTYHNLENEKAGFKFLGFNVRQYKATHKWKGCKTHIKPHKDAIQSHLDEIKNLIRQTRGMPQKGLIRKLNPVIKGWANYYKYGISSKIFGKLTHLVIRKLYRWGRRRHPLKGREWVKNRYFHKHGNDSWRFKTAEGMILVNHRDYKIDRFVKVKDTRSPYDGDFIYWASRMGRYHQGSPRAAELLKKQKGKCKHCKLYFKTGDILEVHHVDKNKKNNQKLNLNLLHGHCHDNIHRKLEVCIDKHCHTEEPYT